MLQASSISFYFLHFCPRHYIYLYRKPTNKWYDDCFQQSYGFFKRNVLKTRQKYLYIVLPFPAPCISFCGFELLSDESLASQPKGFSVIVLVRQQLSQFFFIWACLCFALLLKGFSWIRIPGCRSFHGLLMTCL